MVCCMGFSDPPHVWVKAVSVIADMFHPVVQAAGGVMSFIQRNSCEGRYPLHNISDIPALTLLTHSLLHAGNISLETICFLKAKIFSLADFK